ncbi:MAG: SDR family oxidoreductase [Acidobacteria bacterium]|nr:SDR family oxidoreductase [Acidobacteriota bacterium]
MVDLEGKVVMVTGAAGTLGGAVMRGFAAAGAKLFLTDIDQRRLDDAAAQLPRRDDVLARAADLGQPAAIDAALAGVIARFGRIDALANIAGGYRSGPPLHETSLADWDAMFNNNARSVFLVCKAVVPHMLRAGGGKIVNVSSKGALAGFAGAGPYCASKAAVARLTESMSEELKGRGINVNCVIPSIIDTPPNRAAMPEADYSRWVRPEQLASVILFLASDAAAAIHGAAIPVYGLS